MTTSTGSQRTRPSTRSWIAGYRCLFWPCAPVSTPRAVKSSVSGPIDWVRLRISAAEPGAKLNGMPISHYVIFAFDTEIFKPDQSVYAAPTPENVRSQQEFTFASRFSDVTRFLASGDARPRSDKARVMSWVDQWLLEAYVDAREQQTGRRMRDEEKKTVEHLARYVALVQFINAAVPVPLTRFVDTYSEIQRVRPVLVDLVLDIGNSRTCGIFDRDVSERLEHVAFQHCRARPAQSERTAPHLSRAVRKPRRICPGPFRIAAPVTAGPRQLGVFLAEPGSDRARGDALSRNGPGQRSHQRHVEPEALSVRF